MTALINTDERIVEFILPGVTFGALKRGFPEGLRKTVDLELSMREDPVITLPIFNRRRRGRAVRKLKQKVKVYGERLIAQIEAGDLDMADSLYKLSMANELIHKGRVDFLDLRDRMKNTDKYSFYHHEAFTRAAEVIKHYVDAA